MMPRAIITYELYIAALKLGIAIIPSSEMLRTKDLQYRITHGEINAVIALADFIEEFKGIKEYHELTKFVVNGNEENWISIEDEKVKQSDELDTANTTRDDVAILSYTSGTTGNPKAVTHSHGWGYAHMKMAPEHWLAIKEDDLVWATAAPGWQNGYGVHSYLLWDQERQHLCIMVNLILLVIYHYYKTLKLMCFVVHQQNTV